MMFADNTGAQPGCVAFLFLLQGAFFDWSTLKMTKCQITCKSLKKSSCYFLAAGLMFPAQVGSSQRALARGTTVSKGWCFWSWWPRPGCWWCPWPWRWWWPWWCWSWFWSIIPIPILFFGFSFIPFILYHTLFVLWQSWYAPIFRIFILVTSPSSCTICPQEF